MGEPKLHRDQLADLSDQAIEVEDWQRENEYRARMRTCCSACDIEGAEDWYDRHGIYVTRKHMHCLTDSDRYTIHVWKWNPGEDEPLYAD